MTTPIWKSRFYGKNHKSQKRNEKNTIDTLVCGYIYPGIELKKKSIESVENYFCEQNLKFLYMLFAFEYLCVVLKVHQEFNKNTFKE